MGIKERIYQIVSSITGVQVEVLTRGTTLAELEMVPDGVKEMVSILELELEILIPDKDIATWEDLGDVLETVSLFIK